MTFGLLAEHDDDWVAGSLYLQTVARALRALPESSQPVIKLLMKQGMNRQHYQAVENLVDRVDMFDRQQPRTIGGRFRFGRQCVLRHKRLPRWMEDQAFKSEVSILYPCLKSPGSKLKVPWIGWIPDFQHLHLPNLFDANLCKSRDETYQKMINESAHMIVSSGQALSDLLEHYQADPEKISVYPFRTHADPNWFEGDPKATADAYGLPERFIMFPSQYWRHKEHLTLIEALASMKDAGHGDVCLVLTGKPEDFRHPGHPELIQNRISELGLQSHVHQLGLLPRMEQVQLMRRACAIIQPSSFEGWSMLVEDCRALGKSVILSNIAVHQEQAYAKTHYFEIGNVEKLTAALIEQWPSLKPGPDLAAEAEARHENARLTLQNGQLLMQIFEGVLSP